MTQERDIEFEERRKYLESRGWRWTFPESSKPREKRKLFADERSQLLRPSIRVEG